MLRPKKGSRMFSSASRLGGGPLPNKDVSQRKKKKKKNLSGAWN